MRKISARSRAPKLARRWTHFALWALFSTALWLGLYQAKWRWSEFFDGAALDGLWTLRGPHSPAEVAEKLPQSRDILIIELRHDVPREVLARLLPRLKMARAVGLDLMFADRAAQLSSDEIPLYTREIAAWKRQDETLSRAMRAAGNIVIGSWSEQAPQSDFSSDSAAANEALAARSSGENRAKTANDLPWSSPVAPLKNAARRLCHLGVVPDLQDGVIRRVRPFETIGGKPVPALSLALAALSRGISPENLAAQRAKTARDGTIFIKYLGPRAVWEYYSNRVVFERALDFSPEDFAGKIVLLGQTDYRSKDIFPTPFGDMPGLFIHANMVATLLDADGSPRDAPLWAAGVALVLCLLLVATLLRFPAWVCAPVALLEMLAATAFSFWIFAAHNRILPLSIPLGALLLTYNGVALYEYWRARGTLGRVVGTNTAAQLLDAVQNPRLGGTLRTATAFFCDLRGYSTLSESLPAEQLLALLNLYTAAVVREVQAQGGRPIDYFGDGVFVLFEGWNGSDHALRATRAALATQRALKTQMEGLKSAAALDPSLKIIADAQLVAGIGLHTGPMIIGLVGAENHFKPGAVGDAVNVAARLQSLSDECGFPILLSRATLDECRATDAEIEEVRGAVFCGEWAVKGRRAKVEVFGVSGA